MISDTQQMDTTKGTLFGAYNAVTGYYQNVRNYKNDEAKLQSIVLGGTAQLKSQKAFDLCTSFATDRSEEHTSELQSLMRISYAVFCLKKKNKIMPLDMH